MKIKDAFKLLHTMDGTPDMSMKEAAKKLRTASKELLHIAKLYEHGVSTRDDIVLDQLDDAAMCIITILSYYRDIDSYNEDEDDDCDDCGYGVDCDDCPYDCEGSVPCPLDDEAYAPTEKGRKIIEDMKKAKAFEPEPMKVTSIGVVPEPCVKDKDCETVKDFLQKFNEESDEWKNAIAELPTTLNDDMDAVRAQYEVRVLDNGEPPYNRIFFHIAEEAADICTVLASFLEACGLDREYRNRAQQRVNEHNKERGRW